ncbi:hypothetical protein [Butyrivibrio sp. AD3002]|uniref:hypothetical protein n=1 Tax=Butyrivibrio sp. AD3002 TaxID=1280670 RepID=UPI0003B6D132|nr:hypothetical protein [Butyrivibrio sp. AD3002]
MSIYPNEQTYPSITYGLFSLNILVNRKKIKELDNHTVIIVTDEIIDDSLIRKFAEILLLKGCKNIAFCGTDAEEWHQIFEKVDLDVNGFNGADGYEDFAVMWCFNDIENLPDELYSCWNEVLILCSSMSVLKECRAIIAESIDPVF